MPAEWAPHERTIMGWPCRRELWGDQLGHAKADYAATANAVARGKVHAKTGWIDSANTLGGYIDAADGTRLTFAFYAIGSSRAAALPALDAVTAATYSCGSRLTGS